MKKLFTYLLVAIALTIAGCSESFDDSKIWDKLDDHESRIAKLEELCKQMNTNISSLQTIVKALQNNDYVTGVTPITKDGKTVGYTITFTKSQPITIYHGEDGKDGSTPIIGVKQDTDNIYYWTLNGEWLLDANGNKIKAQGTDGKDGITPQLKIENDYWYISYDNGASWTQLGKATGEDGDSFFSDIKINEDSIILYLIDGTAIEILRKVNLDVIFSLEEPISALPNETYEISYTIVGGGENPIIEVFTKDGYTVTIDKNDKFSGKIVITTPDVIRNSNIIILVSDGGKNSVTRFIVMAERVLTIMTDVYTVKGEGGVLPITITTNVDYSILIDEPATNWISVPESVRAFTEDKVQQLIISSNPDMAFRYGSVKFIDEKGSIEQSIHITQEPVGYKHVALQSGESLNNYITAAEAKDIIWLEISDHLESASDFDFITSGFPSLKKLDIGQTLLTVIPMGAGSFNDNTTIETVILPQNLTELKYLGFQRSNIKSIEIPDAVTSITAYCFQDCKNLMGTISLPSGLTEVSDGLFRNCESLTGVELPANLITIRPNAFENTGLTSISFPNSVEIIDNEAFYGCKNLSGQLILPANLRTIGAWAFSGECEVDYYNQITPCNKLSGDLIIPANVTEISREAFTGCPFSGKLDLNENLELIGYRAFAGCQFIGDLVIPDSVQTIGEEAFYNCVAFDGTLTLGASVTEMLDNVFVKKRLNNISTTTENIFQTVYCRDKFPTAFSVMWSNGVITMYDPFYYIRNLYVPTGTSSLYRRAWSYIKKGPIEEYEF